MRTVHVLFIATLGLFLNGSAWAAYRGGHAAVARPAAPAVHVAAPRAHVAAPHIRVSHPVSHHQDERVHRDIHALRGHGGYGYWYGDDSSSYDPGDEGSDSGPVIADDTPADNCPPPAVDSLAQRNAARDAMDQVQARLTADMQATPQWNEMNATVTQALADLESARQRVEAALEARPDYQAALADKQGAENQADQMHSTDDYSPEEMMPIAQRDLAASKLITQLQTQALSTDAQWLDARARLQATAAGRVAMQNQLHADLLNDPTWQAAREQLG